MPASSKSKVRRVGKPLLLLTRGVGATAKGVWRLARVVPTRRTRGPPLASLSAATMHVDPYWPHPGSGTGSSSASDVGSSAATPGALWPGLPQLQLPAWLAPWVGQQDRQADTDSSTSSSSSRVIEMYNPDNSFPMAITPVQQRQASSSTSSTSSSWRAAHTSHHHHEHIHHHSSSTNSRWYGKHHSGSSSGPDTSSGGGTSQQQQHQLLTVGCRHWGNWWDGRGLLRVKIYDFAIFIDGEQAGAFLPATISSSGRSNRSSSSSKRSKLPQQPLLLEGPPHDQQQQEQQEQAEASSSSGNWLTSAFASLLPALPLGGLGFAAAGAGSSSSSSSSQPSAALAAADGSSAQQRLSRKERRQQRRQQKAAAKLLKQQRRAATAAAAAVGAGAALTAGSAQQQQQQQQLSSAAVDSSDLPGLVKASSSGVGMSLVLKAAREVPLHLLAEEYEKVLRRRLARVGGNDVSDAAALGQLLDSFRHPERLPPVVRGGGGGSVRKGAMIVFERDGDSGTIVARVGPHVLGTVSGSPKLGEALFDLYLGQQPVSQAAKDAAADTLTRIASHYAATTASPTAASSSSGRGVGAAAAAPYYLPQGRHEQIRCRQQAGAAGAAGGGSGLGVADLAACMLHLE